jgi:alpha-D-ribose 1-methylphosphonate 5-triphosphate synthase subunit PhnI
MLELGFSATLGWNEVKVIAASMLDLEMGKPNPHPAHKEEFVLYHTESVESSGFCIHFKLPHYVTFTSGLDNIRKVRESQERRMHEGVFVQTLFAPGQSPKEAPKESAKASQAAATTSQPEASA